MSSQPSGFGGQTSLGDQEGLMDESDSRYSDAVLQAVDSGQKIKAIKLLREETGLGLQEAKHEIDLLAAKRQPVAPTMREEGGAGAIIKVIVGGLIVLAIYLFLIAD